MDDKWRGVKSNADNARKRCLEIAQKWMTDENARREEEARLANEEAARAAVKAGRQNDSEINPPAPVQAEKISGVGNMRKVSERSRTVWVVTDPRAYLTHLLTEAELAPDLVDVAEKIAARRGMEAPGVEKKIERKAA